MPAEDAFIDHLNQNIALANQHRDTALSLIGRAQGAQNKRALIPAEAAAYRADKAKSVFKEALQFQRETKRAADLRQTGMEHIDVCERQLNRAMELLGPE